MYTCTLDAKDKMQEYILVLIGCVMLATTGRGHMRIKGGDEAEVEHYPYMVSLHQEAQIFCGGSILTQSNVLTSAHCLYRGKEIVDPDLVTVMAGATDLDEASSWFWHVFSTMQWRAVLRFLIHKDYNATTKENDIAVIRLRMSFNFKTSLVLNVTLPQKREDTDKYIYLDESCIVTGWGRLEPSKRKTHVGAQDTQRPYTLKMVYLDVINVTECNDTYFNQEQLHIEPYRQMCTTASPKDACMGDSGGPLMCNGVQEGIVSWIENCKSNQNPRVFTRVDYYLKWINDNMGESDTNTDAYYDLDAVPEVDKDVDLDLDIDTDVEKDKHKHKRRGRKFNKADALHVDVLTISMLVMCICCLVM